MFRLTKTANLLRNLNNIRIRPLSTEFPKYDQEHKNQQNKKLITIDTDAIKSINHKDILKPLYKVLSYNKGLMYTIENNKDFVPNWQYPFYYMPNEKAQQNMIQSIKNSSYYQDDIYIYYRSLMWGAIYSVIGFFIYSYKTNRTDKFIIVFESVIEGMFFVGMPACIGYIVYAVGGPVCALGLGGVLFAGNKYLNYVQSRNEKNE